MALNSSPFSRPCRSSAGCDWISLRFRESRLTFRDAICDKAVKLLDTEIGSLEVGTRVILCVINAYQHLFIQQQVVSP